MVNKIDWPTRQGPTKTTRGCILYTVSKIKTPSIFYKVGINPPQVALKEIQDETIEEPNHLNSNLFKNIKYVNTNTQAETYQPLPERD